MLMFTVVFNFEQVGVPPVILQSIRPGYSLLEIALMNGIDMRHDCGGICHCSTCHLFVEKGAEFISEISRREKDVLKKAHFIQDNSRMGCQCLLMEGDGNIEVTLPTRKGF